MLTHEVPQRIYDLLVGGFVQHEAHALLLRLRREGGYRPGESMLHPGDGFGDVLAWLWATDPVQAMGRLTP